MAITVTDAMNAMGQDWECSEVLRAEVCRLRAALAATAPATQPDERAAAERALLDRLAKRILAEIVYCAPENRALAEEVARVARIETDLIVSRDDATSGPEHDTALRD